MIIIVILVIISCNKYDDDDENNNYCYNKINSIALHFLETKPRGESTH